MVFDVLPEIVKNIYLTNFNFMFKLSLIFIFFISSILIVKNFKPKKSKYIMVGKVRLTYNILAWGFILTLPFQIGFLSPNVPLSGLLNAMIIFYTVNFAILSTIVILNVIWYGTGFINELFGNEDFVGTNPLKEDLKKYLR